MMAAKPRVTPFTLNRQYRDYVWGGSKLRPGHVPTAEVWAVYEANTVAGGEFAGQTLADLAAEFGSDLLGRRVTGRIGNRFPILVKLLDCNQWLSLQVHPNDQQAVEMEGPGQFGKTEAWYFLDTEANAEILCGTKPGVTQTEVEKAVRNGTILDLTSRIPISPADYVLIPAGTIHALGPGLLVYEVQESSDITYRVFDWNRPASQGRALHIEKSIRVIDPRRQVKVQPSGSGSGATGLVDCEYFHLEKLVPADAPIRTMLTGESFHAVTAIRGNSLVSGTEWQFDLKQYETLVIPACCGDYQIRQKTGCELLRVTA